MKFYTSYFYQLRFFTPNMIPLSTAAYDPKWFHNFEGKDHYFIDKNGVYNGFRADPLVLNEEYYEKLIATGKQCSKNCGQSAPNCSFMNIYREYLDTIDFNAFLEGCNRAINFVSEKSPFVGGPIIVLLVHEKPDCLCAERPVIHEWFKKHGVEIKEWDKNEAI